MELLWDAVVSLAGPLVRHGGPRRVENLARRGAPLVAQLRRDRRFHLRNAAKEWMGLDLDHRSERVLMNATVAAELERWLEVLLLDRLSEQLQRDPVEVQGLGLLESALGRGQGVVLCTSHAGPHHLAGLTLSLRGLPVVEATVNPTLVDMLLPAPGGPGSALRRYEERARERLPVRTIPTGPGAGPKALRKAVRTLGRGSVLVMPGDGLWGESTIEVPLAAGRARLPTGPPRLAWMTGASLVCGCVLPRGEGRWSLHLGPARQPPAARGGTKSKPAGEWIGASVAWYAQWLEDQIAAWPELFLWRWATIHRLQYLGVEEFFEAGE